MTQTYDFDEMNRIVIREFRDTGGKAGGVFEGMPLVLVHHVGVRSGIERIAPLVPLLDDGRIFVFASKGGSDENPHWYGNLVAHPQITVELGTETFPATARVRHRCRTRRHLRATKRPPATVRRTPAQHQATDPRHRAGEIRNRLNCISRCSFAARCARPQLAGADS